MHQPADMQSRREFLVNIASACATAGVVMACGKTSPDPDPETDLGADNPVPDAGQNPMTPDGGQNPTTPDGGQNPTTPDAGQNPTTPDAGQPQGPNCLENGTRTRIESNHGHQLTVSSADVNAGVSRTYNIQGASDHPHTVTVSAADFDMLRANVSVTVTSTSNGGHTHLVNIVCA